MSETLAPVGLDASRPHTSGHELARLSVHKVRILQLLAAGWIGDQAARQLDVSPRTLRRQLYTVCAHIGVARQIQAVVRAAKGDLI